MTGLMLKNGICVCICSLKCEASHKNIVIVVFAMLVTFKYKELIPNTFDYM